MERSRDFHYYALYKFTFTFTFNMMYCGWGTATNGKAGFYSWAFAATVDIHDCALLNGNTQLPVTASFFKTLQFFTHLQCQEWDKSLHHQQTSCIHICHH